MAKKKVERPKREVTKRQLSRWQLEKKRRRIILYSGILIIVAVLGIVGVGWYTNQYQPLHQAVIRVNDVTFNMDYYVKTLKFYGQGQSTFYMSYLADEVVRIIQQNELVRQEAEKLGISVSQDEVDAELKSYDPPLSRDYRDIVGAELLIDKLLEEHFEHEVPLFAEQRHVMAMFLESESQATEVRTRLEEGEDFADLASELSLESLSKTERGDIGWRPKGILDTLLGTSILEEYAFSSEMGVLSQPIYDEAKTKGVGYWLVKVLEREEESGEAHMQVILLGSEEEAQMVKARLENGEEFAALAEELSQHESKEGGGELGWLTPDIMSSALSEFAFNTEIELNTLSEPIRDEMATTKDGYWLTKVLDEDDRRQIEEEDRDFLKAKALNEWALALWDDPENKVESYLDDEKREWAIAYVVGS